MGLDRFCGWLHSWEAWGLKGMRDERGSWV